MKSINKKIKILLLLLSPTTIALANNKGPKFHTLYIATSPLSPPPPSPSLTSMTQLKPSMAVIVAVLTTMFSITFLLLLYAKHCKRGNNGNNDVSELYSTGVAPAKNSGVDRKIIESLPVFRFGALMGEKDGLECAVCLGRFEQTEVLRLLPKCKHAFHVECVDTWLEAHSTCPLCRYRVDPEDILLIGHDSASLAETAANRNISCPPPPPPIRRVSGRHSSAGERGNNRSSVGTTSAASAAALQIAIDLPGRRSFDSWRATKPKKERKDEALLLEGGDRSDRRKLEHQIVIGGLEKRWSDVQPSDLLYLRSEMIMSDNRGLSSSSGPYRPLKHVANNYISNSNRTSNGNSSSNYCRSNNNNNEGSSGRMVINERSVSEITGMSRFGKTTSQQGVLSRWMAWVPHRQSVMIDTPIHTHQLPAVR